MDGVGLENTKYVFCKQNAHRSRVDFTWRKRENFVFFPDLSELSKRNRSFLAKISLILSTNYLISLVIYFTTGLFYLLTDQLPNVVCSLVVCIVTSTDCQHGYVGSSVRTLDGRIGDHMGMVAALSELWTVGLVTTLVCWQFCPIDDHMGQSSRTARPSVNSSSTTVWPLS